MDSRIMDVLKDRVLELGPEPQAGPYRNFKLTRDSDGIAWLLFDREGASANTLSASVLEEFETVIAALEQDRPAGLVIRSAKPSGFIAGADVNEFRGVTDPREVETPMARAHAVVDRLEALKVPSVAVIHGFCLGGGLEVALACNTRIAIDNARFGFPEVMLGLHPGLGGTARFTHLVSPLEAMTMMLTGKTIDARKAKSLGLADAVTQERHVRNAVKDAIFGRLRPHRQGLLAQAMNLGPVRGLLANRMRGEAAKTAPKDHYPAPYALIDLWEKHGGDRKAMLAAEQVSFANLMVTPTAQNLIRVFFLREQMKKLADGRNAVKHVHVIGAGAMGGDIAAWCAYQGLRVTLADMKAEPIAGAIKRAADLFGKIIRKKTDLRDALDRLMPDMTGEGVRNADLIIEAVPEKLELKQKVYAGLEPVMKAGAILATNTSSIPLQDLRTTLKNPRHLLGLHFFNPVSRLQLVEVVSHDEADPQALATALKFVGAIDRLPLPVKSSPGFLVNRALTPYMLEAIVMLDEKVDKAVIDAAAEKFGMPMGPIELADQVGLDICLAVGDMLRSKFGEAALPPAPDWLREKVKKGELGRKTGKGFYEWKDGKAVKLPSPVQPTEEMIDRLILPMSNVCVACLREGIVENGDVVDGAMIFGTGYAPFRGGPLNYARTRGAANVVAALKALEAKFGDRFKPDAGWDTFA
ncbi:MAG TPA: fatty-acid oxidation protein subunit alpha [Afipia sp.]|uniref:3-hydroxyacyl-CoA dehydrogenase NAD-binding domain-containing protein n=1 Tax=unclassified Afipia TaxID=2642050 RepID=UPI0004668B61|nr:MULTISPECIES: 3-hydroxyacyl-CoA dehydrogenase NAD-binding domain-containing protein [unclassified Afipia]MAH68531.1 fatty-acid oxidation protein subunit alpha [Afipia sp.]OUX62418.1 MAG: fatty-acid oxidation protein subunit alpha [Afipia sp. TMED4]HAP10739.1 fatty-acid oxidation protein subunit alpha [Afipia sp.]HAP47093.1 fatty-acid oxidation protein subunit alpha [Afipia sp.]HAQ94951.1 fatty-acid oxidation protein subunit alpha [Afipia sp.]